MTDRRTLFGAAAVTVIAKGGLRALTHRSVDEEAGLPAGSVNYYAPTRSKLLQLALRSAHQQIYDITVETFQPAVEATGEAQRVAVVDCTVEAVRLLATRDNGIVVARRALIVEAHFDTALADAAIEHRQWFIDFAAPLVEAMQPRARVPESVDLIVALLNGLIEQQSMVVTSQFSAKLLREVVMRIMAPIQTPLGDDPANDPEAITQTS